MSDLSKIAHTWLSQQIEQLGALRNASTRDNQFKQWRQNTLTFIQRIWPDDPQRSERFRRIPFSPPSSKHDPKTGREFYERGCAEALDFLQALLQGLDRDGLSAAMPAETMEDTTPDGTEEAYPLVELPGDSEPEAEPDPETEAELELEAEPEDELELEAEPEPEPAPPPRAAVGPPPVPLRRGVRPAAPARPTAPPARPAAPARPAPAQRPTEAQRPPQRPADPNTLPVSEVAIPPVPMRSTARPGGPSRISVKGDAGSKKGGADRDSGKSNPLENILSSMNPERPVEVPPKNAKSKSGKKGGAKQRLKDMLGFADFNPQAQAEHRGPPPAPPAPRTPSSGSERQAPPPRPAKPMARGPRRPDENAGRMSMPEFMLPEEQASSGERVSPEDWEPHVLDRAEPPPRPAFSRPPDPAGERGPLDRDDEDEEAPRGEIEADDLEAIEIEEAPAAEEMYEEESLPEELEELAEEAPDEEEESEPEDTAAATEFVLNSPIFSSTAKPVQRGRPSDSLNPLTAQTPAASALLSLAAEVNTLGIPEGNRAWARAALVDLARQIESGDLSWEALRDAVHFLMEFPPLARRVLPLLLPFFEKAA